MSTEFPGNSKNLRPQTPPKDEKKIETVVVGEVSSRKKGMLRRFKDLFIGGDSKTVLHYMLMDVLVPQAKDMITEAMSQGFEKLIYGDNRPTRRYGPHRPPGAGPMNYTRYATRGNNPIGRTLREDRPSATAQPRTSSIEDILLQTRVEAETVLERLYDLLREYDTVSVSDLYSLIGWTSSYVDQNWGWTSLGGSTVRRVRDGYVLDLPRPQALD
jgi:hypothetical protein